MTYAVTLDFHNTLASCDSWFELEVRGLVAGFLRWRASERGEPQDVAAEHAAATEYRALRREIIEHGEELSAERCVAVVLDRVGREATTDEIERGVETLMRSTLHDLAPIPGSLELVAALRAAGVRLGVVSSAVYHPFLEWSLTAFGISDAFASIVTSASAGSYKSRPEIYAHALARLGATSDRSVHIGDSFRWDVTTAKRAGMRTVWFNPSAATVDGAPDLEIRTLAGAAPAILDLLERPPERSG